MEAFTLELEISVSCYFKRKQCSWPGWHWGKEGGAARRWVPESWELGQLPFLFKLPLALPMHVSLSQIMQISVSLWYHLWFMQAGSRRKKYLCKCRHMHTHIHAQPTARFGKDFVASKSCENKAWLFSCHWAWRPKEHGRFTLFLPKGSRTREMYNLEWPAALPHWRILEILSQGIFPCPWQHSDFPLPNVFSS